MNGHDGPVKKGAGSSRRPALFAGGTPRSQALHVQQCDAAAPGAHRPVGASPALRKPEQATAFGRVCLNQA